MFMCVLQEWKDTESEQSVVVIEFWLPFLFDTEAIIWNEAGLDKYYMEF